MPQFPYSFFDQYVVRIPHYSNKEFLENSNKKFFNDEDLMEICKRPSFQESIYLASPNLYEEIIQWLDSGKKLAPKKQDKLKSTIIKYYGRMSTRCTPFGLFSGIGLGEFKHTVKKHDGGRKIRQTNLDMLFLVALADYLANVPEIKSKLLFFPNNSIHIIGNKIRFIEYEFHNGKRDYIISSAPLSDELKKVLYYVKEGRTIIEIAEILIEEDITITEAIGFVEELIENQVLISEIDPNVSGNDFLDELISVLDKIGAKVEIGVLTSIKDKLSGLDDCFGNHIGVYSEIENLIKSFGIEYENKYLFQTDMYFSDQFALPVFWKKELKETISFLNKISLKNNDTNFDRFKKAFYNRFESEEIPLLYALDTEIGIGYLQNASAKGVHPYLDDLVIPEEKRKSELNAKFNPVQVILNKKVQESILTNSYAIKLSDQDFEGFDENWGDLPDTISFMAEIIVAEDQEKLYISSSGGASAANLLGRFCSEKSDIKNLTKAIAKKESELNKNVIHAEIIHLPEARIGNVIRRPSLREYEIPYLAQSTLPIENQIFIDDLYISFKNNRIVLRSKKLNKEVMPYLSNAHNYSAHSLPVYHFLSDLNAQDRRVGIYFNWGDLKKIYYFLPRVEYKNSILSKAQWRITDEHIIDVSQLISDEELFLQSLKEWREIRKIPNWIRWVKSDNTLTLNLDNYEMAKLFVQTIKSKKSIFIEEFLYDADDFSHQFIFPLYRNQ
ncbi:lantibiotic dehydratase family protein [Chryseobacterium sp. PTM-20240506]|uniref:lantibiotic dehydratase family protein n=1 Tax=unclassified Chryseobacterium TaxID=2593645 RepID=UPI00235A1C6B|nr:MULTISPECIES: lantibiotic dehydratase family protein [unclassified Chryseobacterium]MDC8106608.1 lantibiotic dehydratase family protein [Chryseobacterium sp. B21-037]MDQ1806492.1 lantibiotic dehydratase family protein [Chryseobacterium sp. CKR4-1]